jgi:hypothetical protein
MNRPARLGNCWDLLDDFLDEIRVMETEYLRAARERNGESSAAPAPPDPRVPDGSF